MALIFIFLDGVGLAPAGPYNPLSSAAMPHIRALLGGPLTLEQAQARPALLLRPIDTALGDVVFSDPEDTYTVSPKTRIV